MDENNKNLDNNNEIVYENDVADTNSLETDHKQTILKLKDKLKECEKLKENYLDDLHRAKADFVNMNRQNDESNKQLIKFSNQNLLLQIIPVLDSFEMAFSHKESWESVSAQWRSGMENIYAQLLSVVESNGVKQISPKIGDEFNPNLFEAIDSLEVSNKDDDNKIIDVVQKGYILGDKIIRSAKVKVGKHTN